MLSDQIVIAMLKEVQAFSPSSALAAIIQLVIDVESGESAVTILADMKKAYDIIIAWKNDTAGLHPTVQGIMKELVKNA